MTLSARERRLQLIGEKASRALGIRSDRLAEHDPAIDESPEVLHLERKARLSMEEHDKLSEEKRRAMAKLEVRTPWNKGLKWEGQNS